MSAAVEYMNKYLSDLTNVLMKVDLVKLEEIYNEIENVRKAQRFIFVFGNGGSAATVGHLICDIGKNTRKELLPRISIISLNDNMPIFSAYANDVGYDQVFKEQILSLGKPGDLAFALSGSGNSPNVLEGIQAAKEKCMRTIGLTGFNGGKLKDLVDIVLVIPSMDMEIIEDVHLVANHMITGLLRGDRYGLRNSCDPVI